MENVKMDIYFPNYLTDEVKVCIKSTLKNLGVKDIKMSEIDNELLEIVIPQEKLESIKIFQNLLREVSFCGKMNIINKVVRHNNNPNLLWDNKS